MSFISGTYVLTDTMGKVFDDLFAGVNANTAVTVRGTSALTADGDPSSFVDREPVPQAVLDKVTKVDGVREALGHSGGYAQVVDKKGKAVKTGGAPSFGVDINPGSVQESLTIKRGQGAGGPARGSDRRRDRAQGRSGRGRHDHGPAQGAGGQGDDHRPDRAR